MINIKLRGTDTIQVENGTTIYEVAKTISDGLARAALGGMVDGEVKVQMFRLQQTLMHLSNQNINLQHFYHQVAVHQSV